MKTIAKAALSLAFAAATGFAQPASAQATNPYLGEVVTFAIGFCPVNWLPLNGQLLPINQNVALYNLLGTTYGGDGQTTFALPTAKPVFTADSKTTMIQCISLSGVFPSRN